MGEIFVGVIDNRLKLLIYKKLLLKRNSNQMRRTVYEFIEQPTYTCRPYQYRHCSILSYATKPNDFECGQQKP